MKFQQPTDKEGRSGELDRKDRGQSYKLHQYDSSSPKGSIQTENCCCCAIISEIL
jgi:hypothetical protein